MQVSVKDVQKKAMQYWYVDGLSELSVGLLFLLLGLTYWLVNIWPHPQRGFFLGLLLPLIQLGLFLAGAWVVRELKKRLTYPRTGFISYRRPPLKKRLPRTLFSMLAALIVSALTIGLLSYLMINGFLSDNWITTVTAFFIAIICLVFNASIRLTRFYILALYVFLAGLFISLSGINPDISNPCFLMLVGVGWLVSGAVTLYVYLKNTSPLSNEALS
ncbi:MAG: hypothetical protein LWX83_17235 [Anaerolineae bacterium]|nr:hypothetical protein [Anaerolineae bacterium]